MEETIQYCGTHPPPSMEELNEDVARHLLGSLADDILGPLPMSAPDPNQPCLSDANCSRLSGERGHGSSGSFHDRDPFEELLQEASNHRLTERFPLSEHCSGRCRINNRGLGDIGSNRFATSNGFQPQEGVLGATYGHALLHMAEGHQPGSESSGDVMKMLEENRVDAYLSKMVDISYLKETMTDPRMSKEFQDLVAHCSGRFRDEILISLSSVHVPLLQVCCNPNGIRSLQKLFEHLNGSVQRHFAATTLSAFVTSLFKDERGQQVIEFCLNNFSDTENLNIFLEVKKHFLEIAKDRRGCAMLMKCLELSKELCKDLLLCTTAENSSELALHPSSNYLVQKLFDFHIPQLTDYTLMYLRENYHVLSADKYGSHVVEKCLSRSSRKQFEEIARELIGGGDFTMLFTDPYGNYVVQAMLSRARDCGVLYDILVSMIEAKGETLLTNPHGGKLLQLIKKPNKRSRSSRFHGDSC